MIAQSSYLKHPNVHFCNMLIRLILLLALFALYSPTIAQKQDFVVFKGDTINRKDAKGLKQGVWRKYYRTDTLCAETWFRNDKPHGVSRTWYESGKLKAEVFFDAKGPVRSRCISYYENGKVMGRGNYFDQKKDSIWLYYAENDSLKSIEQYLKGKANGKWVVYYENGKVAEEKNYLNGKREGLYRQFNLDGTLLFEMTYKDDLEDGPVRLFHYNAKPKASGNYRKGLKEGTWLKLDPSGAILSNEVYRAGRLVKKIQ
jgi:antitoxin component YwqK of YwqJK toxin-antitoxin module